MFYCDITADLVRIFPKIFALKERYTLGKNWQSVSGQTNTYAYYGLGHVPQVYDNGVQLTEQTSIADTESNAGSFYCDEDNNVLYVHATDSDDLTSAPPDIQIGEDFDAYLTEERLNCQEEIDSYLQRLFITPLQPRVNKTHTSDDYDYAIKQACALLICRNVARQRDPGSELADEFEKQAIGLNPEPGEDPGIIKKILEGDILLTNQISALESRGLPRIIPGSSNSATGIFLLDQAVSQYTGGSKETWRIQIDTAGTPGTATWKVSYDTGSNWDKTLQITFDENTDERRIYLGSGLYAIFNGTFVEGDYWDLILTPVGDAEAVPGRREFEVIR